MGSLIGDGVDGSLHVVGQGLLIALATSAHTSLIFDQFFESQAHTFASPLCDPWLLLESETIVT